MVDDLAGDDALRVAATKYKVLFDSFPLGVTIADETGAILESNKEAERILGLRREEQARRQIDGAEWRVIRPDGGRMPPDEYASVRALREEPVGRKRRDGHRHEGRLTSPGSASRPRRSRSRATGS